MLNIEKKIILNDGEIKKWELFFQEKNFFNEFDLEFFHFLTKNEKIKNNIFLITFIFLNRLQQMGYICLDLPAWAGQIINKNSNFSIKLPPLELWRNSLEEMQKAKYLTAINLENPSTINTLLVLEDQRLYFQKNYVFENTITAFFREKIYQKTPSSLLVVDKLIATNLDSSKKLNPEQTLACLNALLNDMAIISGGPGTGKTFLIYTILKAIISREPNSKIALLAPTGKAVNKLKNSLEERIFQDGLSTDKKTNKGLKKVAEEAATLHRFIIKGIGINALHKVDAVIIDEFSMVSFPLFAKLIKKSKMKKIILLGDHHQLPSIDEGAILKDILIGEENYNYTQSFSKACEPFKDSLPNVFSLVEKPTHPLKNSITILKKNYRQATQTNLKEILQLLQENKLANFLKKINALSHNFKWVKNYHKEDYQKVLIEKLLAHYQKWFAFMDNIFKSTLTQEKRQEIFSLLKKYIVLSPVKQGDFSTSFTNDIIEKMLYDNAIIAFDDYQRKLYQGKPIIITQNNYELNVFNGDLGVILNEGEDYYLLIENKDELIPLKKMHKVETFYALTIHKSQGSEFEQGIIVFPPIKKIEKNLMKREIIYTALSRIKSKITLFIEEELLKNIIENPIVRHSGLNKKIWQ